MWNIIVFALYATAFSVSTVIIRFTRQADATYSYDPVLVLVVSVSIRLLFSLVMATRDGVFGDIRTNVASSALYAVPGILYAILEQVVFYILRFGEPVTWHALSTSLKIIVTAVMVRMVFGRTFSPTKMVAVALLTVGKKKQ